MESIYTLRKRVRELEKQVQLLSTAVSTVIYTTIGGSGGSGYIAGAAALRNETYSANSLAYLLYLDSPDDKNGGAFYFDATSYEEEDGVDKIKPTLISSSDPGRWIRVSNPT